ncbi:putative outer membrane protein, probably involved in nutrient binding [Microscilla marina ATCC 23134]|uniref:Putative outer membrane protein, probably involved in nutrient binding n=2 Tax=Microscilla marina TaxID=1027 RepID=A1ZZH2_MICM2|nr:putative outer membrane protein, probably involved in nutrient binding [Microscilla marina ATCC 23134]
MLLLCLVVNITLGKAQNHQAPNQKIQLEKNSGTIPEFLDELSKKYQLRFSYDEGIIPKTRYRVDKKVWQLDELLHKLLQKAHIRFRRINGQIILTRYKTSKITLSGTITAANNGEHLPGAVVYIKELGVGAVSNNYGFYSLTIPPDKYKVLGSYMGYKNATKETSLEKSLNLDLELQPSVAKLSEVMVTANDDKSKEHIESIKNTQMSTHVVEIERIQRTPMLAGEADVLKSIQFLPGVQSSHVGTAGFSVRGGGYDQNLILLDDAPVYNISHAMGLFSVFNTDAVKDIRVYKGAIPAKYGGRLSSVVDIRMKEGNDKQLTLNGGLGIVSSRLTVEGPITPKASFLVSGRYSYLGFTANKLASIFSEVAPDINHYGRNNEINFYDLNAKLNIELDKNNKIYFSVFGSKDHFFNDVFFENNTLDWGNQTGSFRWNHIFNDRLFSNLTLVYGNFDYAYVRHNDNRNFKWSANMQQQGLKLDFDYFDSPQSTVNFGVSVDRHLFAPGKITGLSDPSVVQPFALDNKQAIESAFYVNHQWGIGKRFLVNYGLRFSGFHNIGAGTQYIYNDDQTLTREEHFGKGEVMQSYYGLAPRLSLRYLFNETSSLKASYSRTYQYLHLVSTSSVGLPTDVWLPVDNNIRPRVADQVALGYFKDFYRATYRFSAEAYYKKLYNVIDYVDNADVFLNKHIETQIASGDGSAYGLELSLEKKKGKLTGWINYTWSKATQQIAGINQDKAYAPMYDRRHNLSLVASYKLGKRWLLSTNYAYMTGARMTAPEGTHISTYGQVTYFSGRNNFQLPDFHQLDINVTLKSKVRKKQDPRRWRSEWVFGLTNAYNQRNSFAIFHQYGRVGIENMYHMYLFGLMPSVTYNFKF